jgi:hypothetical protein
MVLSTLLQNKTSTSVHFRMQLKSSTIPESSIISCLDLYSPVKVLNADTKEFLDISVTTSKHVSVFLPLSMSCKELLLSIISAKIKVSRGVSEICADDLKFLSLYNIHISFVQCFNSVLLLP